MVISNTTNLSGVFLERIDGELCELPLGGVIAVSSPVSTPQCIEAGQLTTRSITIAIFVHMTIGLGKRRGLLLEIHDRNDLQYIHCQCETKPNLIRLFSLLASIGVNIWSVTDISFGNDGEDKEELGSGAFKEVRLGLCNDQAVAVKTLNIPPLPKPGNQEVDSKSTAEYHALIQDILMEVRVMSHAAISRHPNVVELVALAFEDVVDLAEPIDFFRPILLLKPSDSTCPDLRRLLEEPGVEALLTYEIINSIPTFARAIKSAPPS
jgi:hypothetical protein